MCKLSLTTGFCLIIASLGLPGLAKGPPKPPQNPCFGRSDGRYRNPNDNYSYHSCVGGQLSIVKCPSNSQYLPTQKVCDYPRDTEPTTTDNGNFCYGRPDGTYANDQDKHSYYSCVSGKTSIQKCPLNCVYIPSQKVCGYPRDTAPTTTDNGNFCYGKPNGQYSNPNDLHSFISCVAGKDHILQCPSDLVYVQSKNACDYPTTHHGNFCLGKTDGRYTNPYDKTTFYSCVGGKLSIENCPPNWVYIPDKSDCQYPAQTTGTHNGNFCQGRPDGLYTYPDDKHLFYQCGNGITYIQTCPSGLVYEPSKMVCDYPAQTSDAHNGIFCYGKPDGQYSNPNDLHSFISCVAGKDHILQCPSDLVYVQSKNACDYPTTHHGNFCLGKTDGRYTNPYDKTTFYRCVGGELSIENCPSNWVYIPDESDCHYPDQTTDTHDGNFCHGRPDGLYTYPLDQHSYYSCASGITYYLQCPSGLVYVPSKNACDYH